MYVTMRSPSFARMSCIYEGFMAQQVLEKRPSCSHAIEFLADICAAEAHWAHEEQHEPSNAAAKACQAQHCYQQLEIADPIRCYYWRLRRRQMQGCGQG